MSQELIQYFEQVLGVREILLQPIEVAAAEPIFEPAPARLLVFVDQKPWSSTAKALFEKMKQAMKLQNIETETLFADQMSAADFQLETLKATAVISFCSNLSQTTQNENLFLTISPEELLQKPELKKQAWDDLQKVMRFLAEGPVSALKKT